MVAIAVAVVKVCAMEERVTELMMGVGKRSEMAAREVAAAG